ncbi:MAG: hypothetical protein AAFY76_11715, partial [Cyanobacteria bacterium J06649_11]
AILFFGGGLYAQTMTLSENLVLTETMVVSEDLTIEGNGFSIICEGCDSVFQVTETAHLQINEARFPRTYDRWIRVLSPSASAAWDLLTSRGSINWQPSN